MVQSTLGRRGDKMTVLHFTGEAAGRLVDGVEKAALSGKFDCDVQVGRLIEGLHQSYVEIHVTSSKGEVVGVLVRSSSTKVADNLNTVGLMVRASDNSAGSENLLQSEILRCESQAVGHRTTIGGRSMAHRQAQAITELYRKAFDEPGRATTMSADSFREQFVRESGLPGFEIATVHIGDDLVGVGSLSTLGSDALFWRSFSSTADADFMGQLRGGPTAIGLCLAVHPDWRGRNVSSLIKIALSFQRPERWLVHSMQHTHVRAHDVYDHWGWRRIGLECDSNGVVSLDILAVEIPTWGQL